LICTDKASGAWRASKHTIGSARARSSCTIQGASGPLSSPNHFGEEARVASVRAIAPGELAQLPRQVTQPGKGGHGSSALRLTRSGACLSRPPLPTRAQGSTKNGPDAELQQFAEVLRYEHCGVIQETPAGLAGDAEIVQLGFLWQKFAGVAGVARVTGGLRAWG
jgi:hypothetical protein